MADTRPQWFILLLFPIIGIIGAMHWRMGPSSMLVHVVDGLCFFAVFLILTFVEDGPYPEEWERDVDG